MKSTKLIALLLMLNLAVIAGIIGYAWRTQFTAPIPSARPGGPSNPGAGASAALHAAPDDRSKGLTATNQFQWAQLESEDYQTYVARLRAVGCPEQTIRDIIIADLDKLMAPEVRTALGRRKDLKYWHPEEEEMQNDIDPREISRMERGIDKRKAQIVEELVHADLSRERMKASGQEDYYERRTEFLPEQLRSKVRQVLERFDEAEQQIRDQELDEEGGLSGAERAQLRLLRQQRAGEVNALLTPQQKQLYDLWLSPVANEVRHATYGMDATEEEFTAIYAAHKQFDETWGLRDSDLLDPAGRQQMEQARSEMETQIQNALGDQRYAEYKRGQDDDFHLLSVLVTRFKLPKEKAADVYGYKAVSLGYRQQVMSNTGLNAEQKDEAIKAIGDETRKAVRDVLGSKAYNYYVRSGQSRWVSEGQ